MRPSIWEVLQSEQNSDSDSEVSDGSASEDNGDSFHEPNQDLDSNSDDSMNDPDYDVHSESDNASSTETEGEDQENQENRSTFRSRDGKEWSKEPLGGAGCTGRNNIFRGGPAKLQQN